MEKLVIGKTLPESYHAALCQLYWHGEMVDCSDWGTECKELSMTMCVENPLQEPMISHLWIGGPTELEQYRMEMLDGVLDFEVAKGNWKYTYHDRMVNYPAAGGNIDQIQFVVDELKRNPSSRRAVITIRTADDIGSDDPACLQHLQFFVHDGKLDSVVTFRSNDACKATFMNAFALIMLSKRIADMVGVPLGTYTHRANSFHCYKKDLPLLCGYVDRIQEGKHDDLYYDFVDGWDEIMEEAREGIMDAVEVLRSR